MQRQIVVHEVATEYPRSDELKAVGRILDAEITTLCRCGVSYHTFIIGTSASLKVLRAFCQWRYHNLIYNCYRDDKDQLGWYRVHFRPTD